MASLQEAQRAELGAAGAALAGAAAEARASAVLSLKASLALVHSDIGEGAQRAEAAALRRDSARAAEAQQLAALGLNPHEVWRARERDARASAAREVHEAAVEARQLAVAGRVLAGDERERAQQAAAAAAKELLDDTRRRHARGVTEAATAAYIMGATVSGADTLDASGRQGARGQLYPSAATLTRPPGWGMGAAAASGLQAFASSVCSVLERVLLGKQEDWAPSGSGRGGRLALSQAQALLESALAELALRRVKEAVQGQGLGAA
jgi:hypothetical protein